MTTEMSSQFDVSNVLSSIIFDRSAGCYVICRNSTIQNRIDRSTQKIMGTNQFGNYLENIDNYQSIINMSGPLLTPLIYGSQYYDIWSWFLLTIPNAPWHKQYMNLDNISIDISDTCDMSVSMSSKYPFGIQTQANELFIPTNCFEIINTGIPYGIMDLNSYRLLTHYDLIPKTSLLIDLTDYYLNKASLTIKFEYSDAKSIPIYTNAPSLIPSRIPSGISFDMNINFLFLDIAPTMYDAGLRATQSTLGWHIQQKVESYIKNSIGGTLDIPINASPVLAPNNELSGYHPYDPSYIIGDENDAIVSMSGLPIDIYQRAILLNYSPIVDTYSYNGIFSKILLNCCGSNFINGEGPTRYRWRYTDIKISTDSSSVTNVSLSLAGQLVVKPLSEPFIS